jgi:hypothetical protein
MSPDLGNCAYRAARTLARPGQAADNRGVMNESTRQAETALAPPTMRNLVLAIVAPFGMIALMASPLLLDAARHAAGI